MKMKLTLILLISMLSGALCAMEAPSEMKTIPVPGKATPEKIDLNDDDPIAVMSFKDLIEEQLNETPQFILARVESQDASGRTYIHYYEAPSINKAMWNGHLIPLMNEIEDYHRGYRWGWKLQDPINRQPIQLATITYYRLDEPNGEFKYIGTAEDLIGGKTVGKALGARLLAGYGTNQEEKERIQLELATGYITFKRIDLARKVLTRLANSSITTIKKRAQAMLNSLPAPSPSESTKPAASAAGTPSTSTAMTTPVTNPINLNLEGGNLATRGLTLAQVIDNVETVLTRDKIAQVTHLMLQNNKLTAINDQLIAFLAQFPNLKVIWFCYNPITELPENLGKVLPHVKEFHFCGAKLTRIPANIAPRVIQ